MPIYTYQCDECGVRFDARQKFSDDPIAECPECGSHTHRVPQPVGIVFKGSGWYAKDSKGKNNLAVPAKKENAASPSKANDMPGTKSDTTSEKKSDTSSTPNTAKKE